MRRLRLLLCIALLTPAAAACDEDKESNGDVTAQDTDQDGVADDADNCPEVANPDQADTNDDGLGDACDDPAPDPDADGDGITDAADNCPSVANPDQIDTDADNLGDACDTTCTVPLAESATVEVNASCLLPPITIADPWNVRVERRFTAEALTPEDTHIGIVAIPVVINLTDDNGDGLINDSDAPDVVYSNVLYTVVDFTGSFAVSSLVAVHGDGSGEIFHTDPTMNLNGLGGAIAADVNGDGLPEIITTTNNRRVIALTHTGEVLWTSELIPAMSLSTQPAVGDLDGDGTVEVLVNGGVVEGATGALRFELLDGAFANITVANLDNAGAAEIIYGDRVLDSTGAVLWSTSLNTDGYFLWTAIVNADDDDEAEVFIASTERYALFQHSGEVIFTLDVEPEPDPDSSPLAGPPCAADLDGDGEVEFAIPNINVLRVLETDGSPKWERPLQNTPATAGCSVYDVNGDGAYEVLITDTTTFWIFDGATGEVRSAEPIQTSSTIFQYPVVADIDQDGSAEILVTSNGTQGSGTFKGITVFGHTSDGWARAGSTWPIHDFAATNIRPDGTLPPPDETPSWLRDNVFRGRPTVDTTANATDDAADLHIEITSTCTASCTAGEIHLAVQATNSGLANIPAGATLALYALDADGGETLLSQTTLDALPGGAAAPGIDLVATLDQLGAAGLRVRVDADNASVECDEDNNTVDWTDLACTR